MDKKKIIIRGDRCKGCLLCLDVCSRKCLEKSTIMNANGYYPVSISLLEECNSCGNCSLICPDYAIVFKEEGPGLDL